MHVEGRIVGSYDVNRLTHALDDIPRLAETVPGLQDLTISEDRVEAKMVVPLPFMQLKSRISGTITRGQSGIQLTIKGRPETLAGLFECQVVIDRVVEEAVQGFHYRLDIKTSGRLASLGEAMLGNVSRKQAQLFEANLRRLLDQENSDE
jgi:carbon monoxide dehydrogenase subunit G